MPSFGSYLALFFFCVLASTSYLYVEVSAGFHQERSDALLATVRVWIEGHTDQVIVIGSLVVGFWLIGQSLYLIFT